MALLLSMASTMIDPLNQVAAQTSGMRPRVLALPTTAYPKGARVVGRSASNHVADSAGGLHTLPFSQLQRMTGYRQVVSWTLRTGREADRYTLSYLASVFPSAATAQAAYADARASLWEAGEPLRLTGLRFPAFHVRRSNDNVVALIGQEGTFEIELVLSYSHETGTTPKALAALARTGWFALRLIHRLSPATPASTPPSYLPDIFAAPIGTGPVVKSPSLMAIDASVMSQAQLDPGAFRQAQAPIARHASHHASLFPSGGLARYVRTGSEQRTAIYDAVTLYASLDEADRAYKALVGANQERGYLTPVDFATDGVQVPLVGADAVAGWRGPVESIIVLRTQNVVMVLARSDDSVLSLATLGGRLLPDVPTWLHAQGTQVVDANGAPVRLAGVNWYGAESPDFVVGGLDYRPYQAILQSIKLLGYNSIRLPFSNELIERNPVVSARVAANPQLQGLHALDIMDRIISYAGALGLAVILDNHRSEAGWSAEQSGLWYTSAYPDTAFRQDWVTIAQRYAAGNAVIGADLRNEPHASATWGSGDPATDWKAAAERAGNAVLAINPHLLILVEGVQFYGSAAPGYWWGGNLLGVANDPVSLHFADGSPARSQLVYSAHDYGPGMCGGGCPWFNTSTTYASLSQVWDQYWGYIAANPAAPYAAPVWVGEFGTCNTQQTCVADPTPGSQGQWFTSLVQYITQRGLGWSYWSANGTQSSAPSDGRTYGATEQYGILGTSWAQPNPFLQPVLANLAAAPPPPQQR